MKKPLKLASCWKCPFLSLVWLSEWILNLPKIVVSEFKKNKKAPKQFRILAAYLSVVMDTGRNNEIIIWVLFF